jgi:hypothetical protein
VAYREQLAAKWRKEIEDLDKSIATLEAGPLEVGANAEDATVEQAHMLRRDQQALRYALQILELPPAG